MRNRYKFLAEKYALINEATTYQLPSSPKYYMADFYMLSLISTIDFDRLLQPTPTNPQGIISAIRGEKYKEDIDYAKRVLYPRLQEIILEDTFFSITCEAYYAAEFLTARDHKEITTAIPTWYEQLMQYVIKYIKANETQTDRDERGSDEDEKTYPQRYKAVINFLTSKGISKRNYIEITTKLFREDIWEDSYGGEAWARIGEAWSQLDTVAPTDYNNLAVYIDHIYDLEHNTGSVFNKIQRYHVDLEQDKVIMTDSKFKGYKWISELLDFKAAINNPFDLLPRTSSSMQKLASPVLKAAGYTRETMQNPDEQYHYNKESENSTEYWTDRNGFLNREGKPAVIRYFIRPNGTRYIEEESYYKHGNLHRIGGPASITYKTGGTAPSVIIYYVDGKKHREDGPALYQNYTGHGDVEYYIHGKNITKEEFELYHTNRAAYDKKQKTKIIEPAFVFKVDKNKASSWPNTAELLLIEAIVYRLNSFSDSYIDNVIIKTFPELTFISASNELFKISNNYFNKELPKFLKLFVRKDRYENVLKTVKELAFEIAEEMMENGDSVWDKDGIYRGPGSKKYGQQYLLFNDMSFLRTNIRKDENFQKICNLLWSEFYLTWHAIPYNKGT